VQCARLSKKFCGITTVCKDYYAAISPDHGIGKNTCRDCVQCVQQVPENTSTKGTVYGGY